MENLKKNSGMLTENLHLFFLGSKILQSSVAYKTNILKINLRRHIKVITKKHPEKAWSNYQNFGMRKKGKMYEVF